MPTTKSTPFMSVSLGDAVPTHVDAESPITRDHDREDVAGETWQTFIDQQLIEWGREPSQIEDEGIEPPSRGTIQQAVLLAQSLRDAGFTPPDSIVPDPNGGIVFERREKDVSEVFHVWDDGTVEYCGFQGARLVERWAL